MSEAVLDETPRGDAPEGSASGRRRPRIAPFVALAVALVLAALFVVLAGSEPGRSDTIESFLIDRPAPEVVSTTLGDQPFDLSRRKGSWVVLNFFDPTCIPCINEHPELVRFDEQQRRIVDGAVLGSDQLVFPSSSLDVSLGADVDDGSAVYFYTGDLDDLRFYDRALDAAELTALANP